MRVFFCVVIALTFCSPVLLAQEPTPSANIEVSAEYKDFFDGFSVLMKKYPAAARRFGMYDRKNPSDPKAPDSTPLIRSAFCTGPGQCCTKYVDVGTVQCLQCSLCLP